MNYPYTKIIVFCSSLFLLTLFAGCALFGGEESLVRAKPFTLSPPPHWKKEKHEESDVAYRLPSHALVTVVSSCKHSSDTSLALLTRHIMIGIKKPVILEQKKILLKDIEGLLTSFTTLIHKKTVFTELFVMKKEDCVFDFSFLATQKITEKERQEFFSFIQSFQYGN